MYAGSTVGCSCLMARCSQMMLLRLNSEMKSSEMNSSGTDYSYCNNCMNCYCCNSSRLVSTGTVIVSTLVAGCSVGLSLLNSSSLMKRTDPLYFLRFVLFAYNVYSLNDD